MRHDKPHASTNYNTHDNIEGHDEIHIDATPHSSFATNHDRLMAVSLDTHIASLPHRQLC